MKLWRWLAVGVVVAGAGWGAVRWYRGPSAPAATAANEPAIVAVSRGDIQSSVSSTGRVVSNLDVDIKCRASGEVIKLPFDVSDRVKKGDLLVELDPSDQQRNVKRQKASVAQSQARLGQSKQNLLLAQSDAQLAAKQAQVAIHSAQVKVRTAEAKAKRRQELVAEKLGSAEDLETAQVEVASAQAELESAQVQAQQAEAMKLTIEVRRHDIELAQAQLDADQIALDDAIQQLAYTHVEAPMDGVVAARTIQIGTIISSGITNIGGGTTVLTLSDLSRLFVLASVDEADIGQVKLGQPATITADAYLGVRFAGKVTRIAAKGVNVSNVVTFEVQVEVTSGNRLLLKPEMTTNVKILTAQRDNVLLMPEQAAIKRKGMSIVQLPLADAAATQPTTRQVRLGLSDGENVEVLDGLKEGEKVLVPKEPASRWSGSQRPPGPPMMH